jgi:DNA-directed RNA polymerase specialized sigma24 family protein
MQLLPYLAVGGNEEARRAFVVRYRPRILRWCRRLQADDAEEVASRVLHKLVVGLARGVYRRHDPDTFRGWLRRVVGNEVVEFARRQRSGRPATSCSAGPTPPASTNWPANSTRSSGPTASAPSRSVPASAAACNRTPGRPSPERTSRARRSARWPASSA